MLKIRNGQSVELGEIAVDGLASFMEKIEAKMSSDWCHCVHYFGVPSGERLELFCILADDRAHSLYVGRTKIDKDATLPSLTAKYPAFHAFEREINEQFGVSFEGHPWLKPLRYSHDRSVPTSIYNYPFFDIEGEELHRVGVGPIHAGIIEPGHFRFICDGEKILHLEIQLGWQHRGVEKLFTEKKKPLELATLAENIAGDSTVAHSVAFCQAYESLGGVEIDEQLAMERTIALEQERIAIHTGDLSAICTDIGYQLGNAVFGRLRTPMINFFQIWCGNRFAKGLIRPGKSNYMFSAEVCEKWQEAIAKYRPDFVEMAEKMFDLPSVLSRIERTGVVSKETALRLGLVGMAAKASGVERDVRATHPYLLYEKAPVEPKVQTGGAVYCRARVRYEEVLDSIDRIKKIIDDYNLPKAEEFEYKATPNFKLAGSSLCVSLVEGWRGEICHCILTDAEGNISTYKIKDPSVHNWMGLAQAVRGNGISDFPICNKSFDLSYCGHDL